jgi:hypothetical protein
MKIKTIDAKEDLFAAFTLFIVLLIGLLASIRSSKGAELKSYSAIIKTQPLVRAALDSSK